MFLLSPQWLSVTLQHVQGADVQMKVAVGDINSDSKVAVADINTAFVIVTVEIYFIQN